MSDFPEDLQFDTSDLCNLHCCYCPYHGRILGEYCATTMPLELVENIMRQTVGHKLKTVSPFCCGEPLLDTRMPEITRIIRRYSDAPILIFTNGTNYQNRHLLMTVDKVDFTISAATSETYALIHGKPLYDEVVKTVEWLEQQPNHPEIAVRFVIIPQNLHEFELWKQQWKRFRRYSNFADENIFAPNIETNSVIDDTRRAKDRGENLPCLPWLQCVIRANGNVVQCCRGGDVWGNVKEEPIADIWKRRIQNGTRSRICRNCLFKIAENG